MAILTCILSSCLLATFLVIHTEARHQVDLSQQNDYFEGDILVRGPVRNAIFKTWRWTNGTIPYAFADYWSDGYRRMVLEAFKAIEEHTCIKFVPRINQTNYIQIINHTGCYSMVGMQGGRQYVSLMETRYSSCWYHGIMIHEFLHAIGLWHEQSRYDRDDHLIIHLQNVLSDQAHNFQKKHQKVTDTYGVPYNYYSLMHYDKYAFTKNGMVTIETKDPAMQNVIGQRQGAADSDFEKIRRLYECKGEFSTLPPETTPPPTSPPPCEDKASYCANYTDRCNDNWTRDLCRRTCGHCNPTSPTPVPTAKPNVTTVKTTQSPSADCKDKVTYCYQYDKKCDTEGWMETYCRKTCKYC